MLALEWVLCHAASGREAVTYEQLALAAEPQPALASQPAGLLPSYRPDA
jgi:hypothetical protein